MFILAESSPSWQGVGILVSACMTVLITLLGWLHVRLTGIAKDNREDHQTLGGRITQVESRASQEAADARTRSSEGDKAIYALIGAKYVQQGEQDAKFDAVKNSIDGLSDRVDDFVSLLRDALARVEQTSNRTSKLEATCEAREKLCPAIHPRPRARE